MEIRIDRSHPTPLYIQIYGQIAYFIGTGVLSSGGQLPAIRHLAGELGVAPLTISQAFSELEREGLVETRAGVGTFVIDMAPSELENFRKRQLREVVEEAIAIAGDRGFSPLDLASALELRIQHRRLQHVIEALFIGNYIEDSALLSALIANEFATSRIHIHYRSIQDLRVPDITTAELLERVSLVLAVPARITEARQLIGGNAIVVGVPIVISSESRERLERVPATAKVGLVARQTNFMQSMRNTGVGILPASCPCPHRIIRRP